MKLCERGLNFVQIYDDMGNVRICSWTRDGYLGSLLDKSFEELYHGEIANRVRDRLIRGDYCECKVDDCPWLACNEMHDHMVELDDIPQYPDSLYLAYENVCNYNCSTCNIHERMKEANYSEIEQRYDKIEEALKDVLPHVKHIGANGQGEVFVSKRILKILQNWQPMAPKEECSVAIETNGSLFNRENWKKLENLGQYYLKVAVTVMSFDEYTYQSLSGTKLPISQVENNLRFIKSLRDSGVIDELEIATVVQERNFREMPEFVQKSIEEFGADYVRLRSFVPWGKKPIEEEWFTDVRNPYHPYYDEYVEVMKNPIFRNPKVHDWSGGIGTTLGEHPHRKRLNYALEKIRIQQKYILEKDEFYNSILHHIPLGEKVIIYGIGEIGKLLVEALREKYEIVLIIDNNYDDCKYEGIPVISMKKVKDFDIDSYIIITPLGDSGLIKRDLQNAGGWASKLIEISTIFSVCE